MPQARQSFRQSRALLPGDGWPHQNGDGSCLSKGTFVLLCLIADQVLHGALQSELNSPPPLLPGWQSHGGAELSQEGLFCSGVELKVHLVATYIDQEPPDLDGTLLRPRSEAGSVFFSPLPLNSPFLKGELACFPPDSFQSSHLHNPQLCLTVLFSSSCRTHNSCESGEGCQPKTAEREQGKAVPANPLAGLQLLAQVSALPEHPEGLVSRPLPS